jgi:hypothetical protein
MSIGVDAHDPSGAARHLPSSLGRAIAFSSCVRQVQQKAMSMKSGRGWRGAPVSRSAIRARRRQAANLTVSFLCSLR